jgi:transposase-like protein
MRLSLMQLAARRSEQPGFLTCPRCRTRMPEVVTIAPMGRQPGLVAYECPKCAYVTSILALSATSHPMVRRRKDAVAELTSFSIGATFT